MSIQIIFNKNLDLPSIEKETKLNVIFDGDKNWIKDQNGNSGVLDFNNEITFYGLNDPSNIVKELVMKYKLRFMTDNEMDMFFHDNSLKSYDLENIAMKRYGYI